MSLGFAFLFFAASVNAANDTVVSIEPVLETPPVGFVGDAADDPAIVTGETAADTRIIGTQKKVDFTSMTSRGGSFRRSSRAG
jgi:hypothetical protein